MFKLKGDNFFKIKSNRTPYFSFKIERFEFQNIRIIVFQKIN